MTIIIQRFTLKHLIPDHECSPDSEESFKIYTLTDNGKNTTLEDIKSLEINDKRFARTAFIKLFQNAATGEPFHKIFDGNQFHTGHEFDYHNNHIKILRLWLAGDIRIYFIFLPKHTVVILKTLAKRKNDLNKAEKKELENITKKIIDCLKNNLIKVIEDKS